MASFWGSDFVSSRTTVPGPGPSSFTRLLCADLPTLARPDFFFPHSVAPTALGSSFVEGKISARPVSPGVFGRNGVESCFRANSFPYGWPSPENNSRPHGCPMQGHLNRQETSGRVLGTKNSTTKPTRDGHFCPLPARDCLLMIIFVPAQVFLVGIGGRGGSRFRISRFPYGSSLPENDSRPPGTHPCNATLIDKNLLGGSLPVTPPTKEPTT